MKKDLNELTDISEDNIRKNMPDILNILLIDRTKSTAKTNKNIIWANDNYMKFGVRYYKPTAQIKPELITGHMDGIIKPRALKTQDLKKSRTKTKAEVFTPTWVVKMQNDTVDNNYQEDDIEKYIRRTWLEITCGEAPYMASRYDMETGKIIPLGNRVGFLDRKLARINSEITDKAEWQRLVEESYKASYGFEWNGDSLLLARENLLYSYIDYYFAKWKVQPTKGLLEEIARIISYNAFQMDGLKYIIPLSEKKEKIKEVQLSLFDEESEEKYKVNPGKRVKIMNWQKNKMEFFDKGVK